MNAMKRLFIALPIADASRTAVYRGIISAPALRDLPMSRTGYANLHLTLQFLGDTDEKRVPELKKIIDALPAPESAQSIHFTAPGCFPNRAEPRVLWLGMEENAYLLKVQRGLTNTLAEAGFNVDRKRFKAHLTLGRVRQGASFPADGLARLERTAAAVTVPDSPINRLTLFESRLQPGGSVYTVLYERKIN